MQNFVDGGLALRIHFLHDPGVESLFDVAAIPVQIIFAATKEMRFGRDVHQDVKNVLLAADPIAQVAESKVIGFDE